jgi:hypothetical protein
VRARAHRRREPELKRPPTERTETNVVLEREHGICASAEVGPLAKVSAAFGGTIEGHRS